MQQDVLVTLCLLVDIPPGHLHLLHPLHPGVLHLHLLPPPHQLRLERLHLPVAPVLGGLAGGLGEAPHLHLRGPGPPRLHGRGGLGQGRGPITTSPGGGGRGAAAGALGKWKKLKDVQDKSRIRGSGSCG